MKQRLESYKVTLKIKNLKIEAFMEGFLRGAVLRYFPQKAPIFLLEISCEKDLKQISFLKKIHPLSEVIVVFKLPQVKLMRRALDRGAFHVFQVPLQREEFLLVLNRIESWWEFQKESCLWRGRGVLSQKIKKQISCLKDEKGPLLIEGESGAGKEIVAQLLSSPHKPFVCVNVAGLSESLFESQMFGYKKGAFTGADRDHEGLVLKAHRGDLFLDEIEALSLSSQAKLLRFLENQEVRAIGSSKVQKVECRILAATNECLTQKVKKGEFRADLLWRLRCKTIELPPLRDRKEDIESLVELFFSQDTKKRKKTLSKEALLCLKEYNWPGNVRELKKVSENLLCYTLLPVIEREDVEPFLYPYNSFSGPSSYQNLNSMVKEYEKEVIRSCVYKYKALDEVQRVLGLSRATLYKKLKYYKIIY